MRSATYVPLQIRDISKVNSQTDDMITSYHTLYILIYIIKSNFII